MSKLRQLVFLALGISLLALVLLRGWALYRHSQREKMAQRLLLELAATPDDSRLRTDMSTLLDTGDLSSTNGNLLLKALVSQHLTQRETYLAGHPVIGKYFMDGWPLLEAYDFRASAKGMAGDEYLGTVNAAEARGVGCEFYRGISKGGKVVSTDAVGEYDASLVITCSLYKLAPKHLVWRHWSGSLLLNLIPDWERDGPPATTPAYQCEITIPVHFRVADIPTIGWAASPELDEQVKRAFTLDPTGWRKLQQQPHPIGLIRPAKTTITNNPWASGVFPAISPDIVCDMTVSVSNSPVDLAFSASFRDEYGVEHPTKAFHFVVKAPLRRMCYLQKATDNFGLPPGHYKGDLILKADKSVAYDNLEINDIWNGTLSFPVEFEIKPKAAK